MFLALHAGMSAHSKIWCPNNWGLGGPPHGNRNFGNIFENDAKKTSHSESVIFFVSGSNFLGKNDKKVKFGKNVRLGLKSMKKVFVRNFCHFRAPWDPTKYQKSQKKTVKKPKKSRKSVLA